MHSLSVKREGHVTLDRCGKAEHNRAVVSLMCCHAGGAFVSFLPVGAKKNDTSGQTVGSRLLCMCTSSEKVCGDGLPSKSSTDLLICVVFKMLPAITALVLPAVCPYRCFAQGGAETCGSLSILQVMETGL